MFGGNGGGYVNLLDLIRTGSNRFAGDNREREVCGKGVAVLASCSGCAVKERSHGGKELSEGEVKERKRRAKPE
ncbi:Bifunctional aspartokinase/homoserine dehydrogenase 1, chloroplastic [Sesbania bispinosa]|nr:Bifunctional aspartokinase/homoserine dehydrogenase 1, chloroplastic [Sesbania bispinosa]